MKKYTLYDNADLDMYFIGEYETMAEVRKAARDYDAECDGEWAPILVRGKGKDHTVISDWCY